MSGLGEKFRGVWDNVLDIARDQLDTFHKIDTPLKVTILGMVCAIFLFLTLWISWPKELEVAATTIVEEAIESNIVVVKNLGEKDWGMTEIILNSAYKKSVENVKPGKVVTIRVIDFEPIEGVSSKPPKSNLVPEKLKITCKRGRKTVIFTH